MLLVVDIITVDMQSGHRNVFYQNQQLKFYSEIFQNHESKNLGKIIVAASIILSIAFAINVVYVI